MALQKLLEAMIAIALGAGLSTSLLAQDAGEHDPATAAQAFPTSPP
jgi:hypothetical protein